MRCAAIIFAACMLTGCSDSPYSGWSRTKTAERADIADANARNALNRIADLQDSIETLERKVDALESELATAKGDIALNSRNIDTLFENDKKLADFLTRR